MEVCLLISWILRFCFVWASKSALHKKSFWPYWLNMCLLLECCANTLDLCFFFFFKGKTWASIVVQCTLGSCNTWLHCSRLHMFLIVLDLHYINIFLFSQRMKRIAHYEEKDIRKEWCTNLTLLLRVQCLTCISIKTSHSLKLWSLELLLQHTHRRHLHWFNSQQVLVSDGCQIFLNLSPSKESNSLSKRTFLGCSITLCFKCYWDECIGPRKILAWRQK